MRITLNITNSDTADQDDILTLEISSEMPLSILRESIQADTQIPPSSQHLYHNGILISADQDSKTMAELGVADNDMLAVHVRDTRGSTGLPDQASRGPNRPRAAAPGDNSQDPELIRLRILGDPRLRQQAEQQQPQLAAVLNDPQRFAQMFNENFQREQRERGERQREIARLHEDPFDIEAQTKIAEIIRQERVMENLQSAMEHNPEVFGRVHMLYVSVEVNGHKVKALVDSGAQATIMSPSCAEACGIMRLVDKRFAGVAKGVGTANIIGRVHSAQIRIGSSFLPCSFTVMEGKSVDLLLGLDMLKRHQASIDLAKDRLVIQGEEVPFLGESEIPQDSEEAIEHEPRLPGPAGTTIGTRSGVVSGPGGATEHAGAGGTSAPAGPATPAAPTPPAASQPGQVQNQPQAQAGTGPNISEDAIMQLTSMGIGREDAINALRSTDGDVDYAANLLFGP